MKKRISAIFAVLFAFALLNASIYAEGETIITADKAEWTDANGASLETEALSATGWGDGTRGAWDVAYTPGAAPTATFTSLPAGMYEVQYYLTKNSESYPNGRSARILDTDVQLKDKNGTYDILSVKDYIYDYGYKSLGIYEFDGTDDYITVTLNDDNKVISGRWSAFFCVSHIKLIPVTEGHTELLTAVNAAASAADFKAAVSGYGTDFVDDEALFNMDGVYEKLAEKKPTGGFTSSYHFKRVFDECVTACLTKVEISASSFVWQNTAANVTSNGYRTNWTHVELTNMTTGEGRAIATFKLANTESIKKMELKLNFDDVVKKQAQNNAVITKYSGDKYENPTTNQEQNKTMNSVVFTDITKQKKLMFSKKDITDSELITAAQKNGYLSLYITADAIDYGDTNGALSLKTDATLTVYYDLTYLGGDVALKYYDDEWDELNTKSAAAGNAFIAISTKSGADFADFDFLDTIAVTENGTALAADDYTLEKVDDATLKLTLKNGFKYESEYKITSEKFIKLDGDSRSYELNAGFTTEKYPTKFSGIEVKQGGTAVTSLDGLTGKISVSATVENNSLPEFKAYLAVNLYERTADGAKMIDSHMVHGTVTATAPLTLSGDFNLTSADTDYFITAHLLDGFTTMNYIKMYNTASWQKID